MQVAFSSNVINDKDSWLRLDGILHFFSDSRHIWLIDDVEGIENSDWLNEEIESRAIRHAKELVVKSYTAFIYRNPSSRIHEKKITVTITPSAENELTPSDAMKCLQEPAYVLVENSSSDGAFLKAMINSMSREKLKEALVNNWWRIEHLGGFGEVEKIAEQIRQRTTGPMRVFVMLDSDRQYLGHDDTDPIRKVQEYCDGHKDVCNAVLWKRKIENYLPVSILNTVNGRDSQKNYKAFLCLNQEQRDYYEMKNGFDSDCRGSAVIPPEQNSLFRSVSSHVLRDLCFGFGREVWRLFDVAKDKITQHDVEMTCSTQPNEICNILDNIESIL